MGVASRFCVVAAVLLAVPAVQAGGIPAKTVKELKAGTVYIKVQFRDRVGPLPATGSGFLLHVDGETGYIVTNNHVVNPGPGAIREGNPKLVFHSATPNEKSVDAEIVAADPARDLAVLKVTGIKELPRPLRIDPEIEASETMPIYSLGFPFGKTLALDKGNHPAINITRGTVTSLRADAAGETQLFQIDAEINPGNSGGPIVDDKGNLVGVAVSKIIQARTVGFAIPIKAVADLMQGKLARVVFDTVEIDKERAQVRVQAELLDPLGKVGNVAIYYRRFKPVSADKDAGLPRPDKDGKVPLLKDARRVALNVEAGHASATFPLDRDKGSRVVLVFQAAYANGASPKIVTPASISSILFPSVVINDKLSRNDPLDKLRRMPSKQFIHRMLAGKHYVIEMRGDPREIDPWLILRDSSGKVLAQDDDSGGYPNALIVYSPDRDDDYEITATVFDTKRFGPFSVRIREETAVGLGPKGVVKSGTLSGSDPSDPLMNTPAHTFNVALKKDQQYFIDVTSKDFDPYVRLENMAGLNLRNEDLGGNGQSTLVFVPAVDGIYRVVATTYDRRTGGFNLKVTERATLKPTDVPDDGLKLADSLTKNDVPDIEFGKLTNFRCKMYELNLKAGQRYQLDLASNDFDPVLRIEDARGKELAYDRDAKGKLKAGMVFAPTTDGTYRVVVSHFDDRLGRYTLSVRPQGAAPKD